MRHHRRVFTRRAKEPTSWFRQSIESSGEDALEVVGGDIFDPTTLGVLGDGEDFELTVLRIRISTVFTYSVETNDVANGQLGVGGFAGVALVGTDTALPDPALLAATDVQTDWLALRGWSLSPNLLAVNLAVSATVSWELDVKAKRKVGIGEHLVYAIDPSVMGVGNFTTDSIVSVLWQRSARR